MEPRDQLEILNEITRIATSDLALRPMLQRITEALAAKFDWQFVALVSIDTATNTFTCEAVTTTVPTSVYVGYGRPLGSGVVGAVAESGEAVLIDDVSAFPSYVETMPGARSELCVPVKHHGRIVAVLNLESTRPAAFHAQLELLTTVADQIAGAIANAQAHEELERRARLMEMMSEVSRTALEATDLHELLDRVVRYIHERFPLELVSIVLVDADRAELVQAAFSGAGDVAPSTRSSIEKGIVGRAIRNARTQYVADVTLDSDYISVNPRTASEVVVPILFHGAVLGVINLESISADVFTPANVLAFEAFADQVAGAIHFASINERLADATRQLEAKTHALEQANEHLATAIETLHRISTQDGLTGLANRRHFDETLALEWRRAMRSRMPLSLLLLDLDAFKEFNDAAGHQAGDDCLRRAAEALRESVHRAADLVARYGGEELVVLLPETDDEHARAIAEHLRERIEMLGIEHPGSPFGVVTVSIGVATAVPSRDGEGCEELVRRADAALYEAKRTGRNRVA